MCGYIDCIGLVRAVHRAMVRTRLIADEVSGPLTRSLTHFLNSPFHSLTHSPTHSPTLSLTQPLTHSITHLTTHPLIHSSYYTIGTFSLIKPRIDPVGFPPKVSKYQNKSTMHSSYHPLSVTPIETSCNVHDHSHAPYSRRAISCQGRVQGETD